MKGDIYIAVDFDGTIVEHDYPRIGDPVPGALEVMKELENCGYFLILYTMRSGVELNEAKEYCRRNGIHLHGGINRNVTQDSWTKSPKAYAHIYIDDAALGCPLIVAPGKRPYVCWKSVRKVFVNKGML